MSLTLVFMLKPKRYKYLLKYFLWILYRMYTHKTKIRSKR